MFWDVIKSYEMKKKDEREMKRGDELNTLTLFEQFVRVFTGFKTVLGKRGPRTLKR
jgi:hypothetical protein